MYEVRPSVLQEINSILERSYFTSASFTVSNNPNKYPFLVIEFNPQTTYKFEVSPSDNDEGFSTNESPGEHISSGESFERINFDLVIYAVENWIGRIRDDFDSRKKITNVSDEFIEKLRDNIFSNNSTGEYSESEIKGLKTKLNKLSEIVEKQAEQLEASEYQIKQFKKEIENIKNDLEVMPKGVWNKVAGNKLLKSISGFLKTSEGRSLISEGIKKLLE